MHSSILFCVLVHEMHNVVIITREIELTNQKLINWHSNVTRREKRFWTVVHTQAFINKQQQEHSSKSCFLFCEHFYSKLSKKY
jgi:hypothetical protein